MIPIADQTVSALYVAAQVQLLAARGLARAAQLEVLDLAEDDLADPRARVHIDELTRLYECAAVRLDLVSPALVTGFDFRISAFTRTGTVLAHCRNLAEGVRINRRYQPLVETAGRCDFVDQGAHEYMAWEAGFDRPDPNAHRHVVELIFGGYATTIRWLGWALPYPIAGVEFRHSDPDAAEAYARVFSAPVRFGAGHDRIRFTPGVAHADLPTHNPEKLAAVRLRLDRVLYRNAHGASLRGQVEAAIRQVLAAGCERGITPKLEFSDVAGQMSVPSSQLRQRLRENGLEYRTLRDQTRAALFDEYARQSLPLSEITHRLGYSDQAALTRAFKRWHGMAPGAYVSEKLMF